MRGAALHFVKFQLTIDVTDQIGAVESVKAASDIFAPVTGKIVKINESLGDQPSLLNRSPEHDGAEQPSLSAPCIPIDYAHRLAMRN